MTTMTVTLSEPHQRQTPLYQEHLALNAKMIPFGGWAMPLQYDGILREYQHCRKDAAVFDTSHMGEFLIEGKEATKGLDHVVTQSIMDMPVLSCRYGLLLDEHAGILDDLIVYRRGVEQWMVVVNAATMSRDFAQMERVIGRRQGLENVSDRLGKLDVQGPRSYEILSRLIGGLDRLRYYTFDHFQVMGERVAVSRTGYTGELGFEIYYPWDKLPELWRELLGLGCKPAGLGVRDLLRIEMGYSLYGHEISEEINPLDAGLFRFVDWGKSFHGKEALLGLKGKGRARRLVCLKSESRRAPRQGQRISFEKGEAIGAVTSGTFSPSLACGIGLGYVREGEGDVGDRILIGDAERPIRAQIVQRPLYTNGSLKA
jgi:aminomethyltransferase